MSYNKDDFWDLGDYRKKSGTTPSPQRSPDTKAATVELDKRSNEQSSSSQFSDSSITKFIPPRSDNVFKKKHLLYEYEPQNSFIKSVRLFSEKPNDTVFLSDNLFMRERAALVNRTAPACDFVPYYSYSPRYSQLTKPQLRYYLWWREHARRGEFLQSSESYIMLYAYELAATCKDEDLNVALNSLCSLLTAYSTRQLNIVMKTIIRDIICDFCLVHELTPPSDKLAAVERQVINNSFLPEMFVGLNVSSDESIKGLVSSSSLYDYKKSKFCTPENVAVFDEAIIGAVSAVLRDKAAFEAITSFTRGVYGAITSERHPFSRMVNIVNRSVSVEVTYFELSGIRPAITDMVRYSENKLREHLGIKNKISILSVNPIAKAVIDAYFDANYPPRPVIDRRRRDARIENEVHEYDKLYDVPKAQISPERALEIERQSWDTTKILTEAFASDEPEAMDITAEEVSSTPVNPTPELSAEEIKSQNTGGTYEDIRQKVGEICELIKLCASGASVMEQRRFASSHGVSLDELADVINEAAVDIIGDIILEDDGTSYVIIEDYKSLFDDL